MDSNFSKRRFWLAGKREAAQDLFFKESLSTTRWQPGDEDNWHTCWYTGMPAPTVFEKLKPGKTINHIPGNNSLTIKSSLHDTLAQARGRMAEQNGAEGINTKRMAFFPRIYSMPNEYHALLDAADAAPEKRWILKPRNSARGKGIKMVQDIATVPLENSWMVQEYLDQPHIMNGHKYVLRLYVLISSVEPLRVYLYNEGSAKLASAIYDLEDLENPYSHLTNPDLNANNLESESPVVFISLHNYRAWLREQGHDDAALFERIRDLIALTMIAAREKMRSRCNAINAETSGCYELLGLDCLVDSNLKPWILECNLSPSLDICAAPKDGGDVEARNKRQLVMDTVQLLGLNEAHDAARLAQKSVQQSEQIRLEAEEELARSGEFSRIYPTTQPERYLPFFPFPRLADMVLADAVSGSAVTRPTARPRESAELISDEGLRLYDENSGTLFAPNPTASWIWLRASDGANPDVIADELLASRAGAAEKPDENWATRQQVWDIFADWATSGLLLQQLPVDSTTSAHDATTAEQNARAESIVKSTPGDIKIQLGSGFFQVRPGHQPVATRLDAFLSSMELTDADGVRLEILRSSRGYAVAENGRLLADGFTLNQIAPMLCRLLQQRYVNGENECAITGMLIPLESPRIKKGHDDTPPAMFVVQHPTSGWDMLSLRLADRCGHGYAGGIRLRFDAPGAVTPLGLPALIAKEDAPQLAAFTNNKHVTSGMVHLHELTPDRHGYLIAAERHVLACDYDVRSVILPSPRGLHAVAPWARRIKEHEALATLLPSAISGARRNLSADAARKLSGWLAGRELWMVDTSDSAAGIDALLKNANAMQRTDLSAVT